MTNVKLKVEVLDNNINVKLKQLLNNDINIKLKQLLNELNFKLSIDNLSKLIELILIMYLEDYNMEAVIKSIEKLEYGYLFEDYNTETAIKLLESLKYIFYFEDYSMNFELSSIEKVNYEYLIDIIHEASVKLYEKLKIEMVTEDFEISIQGGISLVVMRPVSDLKTIIMSDLKTMALKDLYYTMIQDGK